MFVRRVQLLLISRIFLISLIFYTSMIALIYKNNIIVQMRQSMSPAPRKALSGSDLNRNLTVGTVELYHSYLVRNYPFSNYQVVDAAEESRSPQKQYNRLMWQLDQGAHEFVVAERVLGQYFRQFYCNVEDRENAVVLANSQIVLFSDNTPDEVVQQIDSRLQEQLRADPFESYFSAFLSKQPRQNCSDQKSQNVPQIQSQYQGLLLVLSLSFVASLIGLIIKRGIANIATNTQKRDLGSKHASQHNSNDYVSVPMININVELGSGAGKGAGKGATPERKDRSSSKILIKKEI